MAVKTVGDLLKWLKKYNRLYPVYACDGNLIVVVEEDGSKMRGEAIVTDEPGFVHIRKEDITS